MLKGVIVPLITPLTRIGSCDTDAVERLVEHLVQGGVHGVMPAGTSGEALALSPTVRRTLIEHVVKSVAGRIPVVAGVGATCLEDVLGLCEHAAEAGADAVALHPPPYFPLDTCSLRHFYEKVIEESRLPVALYTIPSFAGNVICPELVDELARHENVIALKDSTSDPEYRREVIEICRNHGIGVLAGDEMAMVDALREGAVGIVPSSANLMPQKFVELVELCQAGDWNSARGLQQQLNNPVLEAQSHGGWLAMMRWLKAELAEAGLCTHYLAPVFSTNPENEMAR